MLENFEKIIASAIADEIAFSFCLFILFWFVVSLVLIAYNAYKPSSRFRQFLAITPSALASLGVLGTFMGILLGLLEFDVADVDASIPNLLGGLKIAFITSIFGIAASIVFRAIQALTARDATAGGISAEDIYNVLNGLRQDAQASSQSSQALLKEVRQAISSENDTSLLSQVQKLRTTIQDTQEDLIREFREFSAHMVENNQAAIVEALESVIRDFNSKISEQFGDNFKELNQAVGKVVDWQENYRLHVESVEDAIRHAVDSIVKCEEALSAVRDHTASIPLNMQHMPIIVESLNSQIEALSAQLEAIAQLRTQALEAFPVIEQNLKKLTDDLGSSLDSALRKTADALEIQQSGMDSLTQSAANAQERFGTALEATLDNLQQQSSRAFDAIRSQTDAAWERSAERMEERINELDRQITEELNRAMRLIADHLTGISSRFAEDYQPLADKLRNIVRIAEGVQQ